MKWYKYWGILFGTLAVCIAVEIYARKNLDSWWHAIILGIAFAVYANVFHQLELKDYKEKIRNQ